MPLKTILITHYIDSIHHHQSLACVCRNDSCSRFHPKYWHPLLGGAHPVMGCALLMSDLFCVVCELVHGTSTMYWCWYMIRARGMSHGVHSAMQFAACTQSHGSLVRHSTTRCNTVQICWSACVRVRNTPCTVAKQKTAQPRYVVFEHEGSRRGFNRVMHPWSGRACGVSVGVAMDLHIVSASQVCGHGLCTIINRRRHMGCGSAQQCNSSGQHVPAPCSHRQR
jgi:hypothetical protein